MATWPQGTTISYKTRHLRRDVLDRLRVIAMIRKMTLEEAVNEALALGTDRLEAGVSARGAKGFEALDRAIREDKP